MAFFCQQFLKDLSDALSRWLIDHKIEVLGRWSAVQQEWKEDGQRTREQQEEGDLGGAKFLLIWELFFF